MFSNSRLIIFYIIFIILKNVWTNEIQFDRAEVIPLFVEGLIKINEFRVTKFNRTSYVLNIDVDILNDIDEYVKGEASFYYNRLNNNQYNKSPLNVPRSGICKIADKYYPVFVMEQVKNSSNLPQYEAPDTFCQHFRKVKKLNEIFPKFK